MPLVSVNAPLPRALPLPTDKVPAVRTVLPYEPVPAMANVPEPVLLSDQLPPVCPTDPDTVSAKPELTETVLLVVSVIGPEKVRLDPAPMVRVPPSLTALVRFRAPVLVWSVVLPASVSTPEPKALLLLSAT